MTAPAEFIEPIAAILFPVAAPSTGGITARYGLDQPTAEAALKAAYVQDNPAINNPLAAIYEGLPAGVPLPLGMLMKLAEQITGIDVTEWVDQWQANPVVENISVVTQDVLGKIFTVLAHLQALWDSVNFLDPDFEASAAWAQIIETVFNLAGALSLDSFADDVQDELAELGDAAADAWDKALEVNAFVQEVVDAIITAIRGIPFVGGTIANVLDDIRGLRETADEAVPRAQVGATSGVAPVDATQTIPWEYLPAELGAMAGSVSHVTMELPGNQSINSSTETKLTGLTQTGPITVTFSSNDFLLPLAGFWDIEVCSIWGASSTGQRQLALKQNGTVIRADGTQAASHPFYPPRNNLNLRVNATPADQFSVHVWQNSGGAINTLAAGTYIKATYAGASSPLANVTFDSVGVGDTGAGTLSWSHTFGPDSNTIVVSISHTSGNTPTITCGGHNVPLLSGPTWVGNYFGYDANHSFAAAILPTGVRGTTQTVTVTFAGGSTAGSAQSTSFNGVGSLGAAVSARANSGPAVLLVPSNESSMVAMGFGGMDVAFSSFSQTVDDSVTFSAFNRWTHLIGHAPGGSLFTASAGRWSGKGIELHP